MKLKLNTLITDGATNMLKKLYAGHQTLQMAALKIITYDRCHVGNVGDVIMSTAPETLPVTEAALPPPAPVFVAPLPPAPLRHHVRPPPAKHTVHWFRKGLRLHDNPALRDGLVNATTFRCVFIIDPWFASSSNVGINKWRFLLQCLEDLDNSLKKLNSRLFVVRGQPADALPKLFQEWGTNSLTFEEDPEPYGRVRDHNIMTKCRECGITVTSRVSHTLYKLDKIIERNGGKAPLTYHQFQALIASMPPPPPAVPVVNAQTLNGATTPLGDDHDERFGVPTLDELGFDTENLNPPVWIGGESEGLARLERHLERKAWVASFGRPKMTPQSLLASQTGLSPYLRFGCLSTRLFYYQLTELYKRIKRVRPPLSLHGQILWREFFYCAATKNPNFDRMEGNPICVQIPWQRNAEALSKWANGTTGYPWIDAIMTQLREEGWIHHLARHAVACFLTRGDLWISWEDGMKVFDELLLDADWSVNAGMWMWLSCSSFFQQFFHCYCPVRFGRKTDPNGDFIRRYIPVLKDMPTRYIHEPWVAPDSVQEAAHCVIGRDYPLPMVDHQQASQVNVERIKQVYSLLANFKPTTTASAINQNVQRPSVTQSSPSPTSIIASINQSNFLCSQSPNPTTTPSPQTPYKDTDPPEKPMKQRTEKLTPFKEIVIIQQPAHSSVALGGITETQRQVLVTNGSLETTYKISHSVCEKRYEFKNLAIHNIVAYANSEVYQSPPMPNELYEQVVKMNSFGLEKPKYFKSYTAAGNPRASVPFIPAPLPNYPRRRKKENTKEENDEFSAISTERDGPYTGDNKNNQSDQ